jgi:hypothetical protein
MGFRYCPLPLSVYCPLPISVCPQLTESWVSARVVRLRPSWPV